MNCSSGDAKALFYRLLPPDEQYTMNLFSLILSDEQALAWTDGRHYLAAQSSGGTPLWLWLAQPLPDQAVSEVAQLLAKRLAPGVRFIADPARVPPVLERLKRAHGLTCLPGMPMTAYVCRRVTPPAVFRGEQAAPEPQHQAAMASLLTQLVEDGEGQSIPPQEAARFAQAMTGSDALRLWLDEGRVCAMALIAHRAQSVARINTVVTDRALRGRGYAGMLVAGMCASLLAEGITPMLYADARNPASNRAYLKIGFEPVGQVTEYRADAPN